MLNRSHWLQYLAIPSIDSRLSKYGDGLDLHGFSGNLAVSPTYWHYISALSLPANRRSVIHLELIFLQSDFDVAKDPIIIMMMMIIIMRP